ncbi:MAG: hypothetical protein LBR08_13635 [Bacteroidales bacterium]|jgi:hypothetical protein|nr:hypothetical protein [Bacteroidales bacterium]
MENRHQQAVPADSLAEVLHHINTAKEILKPYLLSLTAKDRINMPKMGDKLFSFVRKTGEIAGLNPQFCPSFFDREAFRNDLTDAVALQDVFISIQQLSRGVEDTIMIAGSEAYLQALTVYNSIRMAAKNNQAGAKVLYDELAESYPMANRGKSRKSNDNGTDEK